jgi:DNA-directed RNA polymerase specialized sigma24 family protein
MTARLGFNPAAVLVRDALFSDPEPLAYALRVARRRWRPWPHAAPWMDAEDLAQDGVLRAYRAHLRCFPDGGAPWDFRAWLAVIVAAEARNRRRRRVRVRALTVRGAGLFAALADPKAADPAELAAEAEEAALAAPAPDPSPAPAEPPPRPPAPRPPAPPRTRPRVAPGPRPPRPPAEQPARVGRLPDGYEAALPRLGERDRELLVRRFGLDGRPPARLREIDPSVSRERVRQRVDKALGRLARLLATPGGGD